MTRRQQVVVGIVAALIVLVAIVLAVTSDDGGDDGATTTTTSTTALTTTTTVATTTSTSAAPAPDPTVMWPVPGGTAFTTPADAARSFAVDVLGFRSPLVGSFRQGDTRSGEVPVKPSSTGPETTVLVRQVSGSDDWSVLGATTANIAVDSPAAMAAVGSPVRITGRAHTFEGNVEVSVRDDTDGEELGHGYVTGGGDMMRPFEGAIAFRSPATKYGTLVLLSTSAKDGSVWEAAALRIAFAGT